MANKTLIGGYPAIGIRPVIDGRTGPMQLRQGLEDQIMGMAQAAKKLYEENLRYSDGSKVKVVIADGTIGRVPESAACQEKFQREGVAITLTVTACWCYGSETMDMDPMTIKGVWGFNATERPGAVYLASVLATHAQKGLPAFGIYGHEVQDKDDVNNITDDVKEKLLRFGRAAIAAATMRGKSYLQIGSMCMGIGGSIIDQAFMEEYLGMRVESIDEVEILRRMEEGIYDHEEVERALAWTKEHCKEGRDDNPDFVKFNREQKDKQWEFTIKMYCIIKDLMKGNKNLPPQFDEEMLGHNAIAGGFQGQRQWTDHWPNCDYPEAVLNSTFDFEGKKEPIVLATENDVLNGLGMLFMKLLTNRAQIFADVRTFWSPESTKRVTGYDLEGHAKENGGIIHLLNSGAACLDACGECTDEDGNHVMKQWWDVTDEDIKKPLHHQSGDACDHDPPESGEGSRTCDADRRGLDREAPGRGIRYADGAHESDLALHLVHAALHRRGRVQERLRRDEQLGREPWRYQLRPHRRRPDYHVLHAENPRMHAQRSGREDLPPGCMERLRNGQRGTGLPRMRSLWPDVPEYEI